MLPDSSRCAAGPSQLLPLAHREPGPDTRAPWHSIQALPPVQAGMLWRWAGLAEAPAKISLRAVNAGLGTTATHAAYEYFCRQGLRAAHWKKTCNIDDFATNDKVIRIVDHYERLQRCNSDPKLWLSNDCQRPVWRHAFARDVIWLVTSGGVEALADVPYANFVPELLALAPSLKVVHTMREPYLWSELRLQEKQGRDIICRNLSQAYSLGSCLEGEGSIADAVHTDISVLNQLTEASHEEWHPESRGGWQRWADSLTAHHWFANLFAAYNARIAALVPPAQYSQQCAWDPTFTLGDFGSQVVGKHTDVCAAPAEAYCLGGADTSEARSLGGQLCASLGMQQCHLTHGIFVSNVTSLEIYELLRVPAWWRPTLSLKELGIVSSHLKAWGQISRNGTSSSEEWVVILECTDAMLNPHMCHGKQVPAVLRRGLEEALCTRAAMERGLVYLGRCSNQLSRPNATVGPPDSCISHHSLKAFQGKLAVASCTNTLCTHAYAIQRRVASDLYVNLFSRAGYDVCSHHRCSSDRALDFYTRTIKRRAGAVVLHALAKEHRFWSYDGLFFQRKGPWLVNSSRRARRRRGQLDA